MKACRCPGHYGGYLNPWEMSECLQREAWRESEGLLHTGFAVVVLEPRTLVVAKEVGRPGRQGTLYQISHGARQKDGSERILQFGGNKPRPK